MFGFFAPLRSAQNDKREMFRSFRMTRLCIYLSFRFVPICHSERSEESIVSYSKSFKILSFRACRGIYTLNFRAIAISQQWILRSTTFRSEWQKGRCSAHSEWQSCANICHSDLFLFVILSEAKNLSFLIPNRLKFCHSELAEESISSISNRLLFLNNRFFNLRIFVFYGKVNI